jgi:hypothetical protein
MIEIAKELGALTRAIPEFQLFVFADSVMEMERGRHLSYFALEPVGAGTNMAHAFRHIAGLGQGTTIFMSDGDPNDEKDYAAMRAIADAMPGAIHTFLCCLPGDISNGSYPHVRLMQDLARIGGGECFPLDPPTIRRDFGRDFKTAIRSGIRSSTQHEESPMADKRQLPDVYLDDGDEFTIQAPDKVVVDARQEVEIIRGTVFQERFVDPEWRERIGGPARGNIQVGGGQVNVQESDHVIRKGFMRKALDFLSPGSQGQIAGPYAQAQGGQYRGQAIPVDYAPVGRGQPALPSPQSAPSGPGLPAPQASGRRPASFAIEHKAEVPMPAGGRQRATLKIEE